MSGSRNVHELRKTSIPPPEDPMFDPRTGDVLGNVDAAFVRPADLDGDGDVGAADLAGLLGSWGPSRPTTPPVSAATPAAP